MPTPPSAGDGVVDTATGSPPPSRLLKRWPVEVSGPAEPLAPGSWKVAAGTGAYLLKEYFRGEAGEPGRRRVLFQHTVTSALDAAGLPVLAPLPVRRGERTLVTSAGRGYALYPWAGGRRRDGLELTFGQCERLGELLGLLHAEMDRCTPPVQQTMLVPTPRASDAIAAVETALDALPSDTSDDLTALTARRLRRRLHLLTDKADHQPPEIEVATVGHLHGSFHEGNLRYGGSGHVTAVLGWDGLSAGPVAGEVVRAAARLFACDDDRGLDLDRVQAFVRGHRSAFPLDADQIQAAVHREWWERLCDLGGDNPALVRWWSEHLDHTLDAFAVPYTRAGATAHDEHSA